MVNDWKNDGRTRSLCRGEELTGSRRPLPFRHIQRRHWFRVSGTWWVEGGRRPRGKYPRNPGGIPAPGMPGGGWDPWKELEGLKSHVATVILTWKKDHAGPRTAVKRCWSQVSVGCIEFEWGTKKNLSPEIQVNLFFSTRSLDLRSEMDIVYWMHYDQC